MKYYTIVMTGLVLVGSASFAAANPAMLPKHPGYPSGESMPTIPGKKNLTVEQSLSSAAASEDAHTGQKLVDPNNARLVKPQEPVHCRRLKGRTSKLSRRSRRRLACPSSSALVAPEERALPRAHPFPYLGRVGERTGLSQGAGWDTPMRRREGAPCHS